MDSATDYINKDDVLFLLYTAQEMNDIDVEMKEMEKDYQFENTDGESFGEITPPIAVATQKRSHKCAYIATGILVTICVISIIGVIAAAIIVSQVTKENSKCTGNIDMEQWAKVDAVCANHATQSKDEPCHGEEGSINMSPYVVHQLYMTLDMVINHACKNYLIKVFENSIEVEFCGGVIVKLNQDILKFYQHDIKARVVSPDEIKYSSFDVVDLPSGPHGMFKKTVQFFDYIEISDDIKYISVSSVCRYFNK